MEAPEVIDLADSPSPPRSAILEDLRHRGLTVSLQKVPQVPLRIQSRLPPGISVCHTSNKHSSTVSSNTMTPTKAVSLPDTLAGALAGVAASQHGATKTKVELELSAAEMAALRFLGILS